MNAKVIMYKEFFQLKNLERLQVILARFMRTRKYQIYEYGLEEGLGYPLFENYTMSDFPNLLEKFKSSHDFDLIIYFHYFTLEIGKEIFKYDKERDALIVKDVESYYYLKQECLIEEVIYITFAHFDTEDCLFRHNFNVILPKKKNKQSSDEDHEQQQKRKALDRAYELAHINYLSLTNSLMDLPQQFIKDDDFRKAAFKKIWSTRDYARFDIICNKLAILRMHFCDMIHCNFDVFKPVMRTLRVAHICSNSHNILGIIQDIKYDYIILWTKKKRDFANMLHDEKDDLNGESTLMYRLYRSYDQLTVIEKIFIGYYMILKREYYNVFLELRGNRRKSNLILSPEGDLFFMIKKYLPALEKIKQNWNENEDELEEPI